MRTGSPGVPVSFRCAEANLDLENILKRGVMSEVDKPKLIFHIGMGKTGSTSLQLALRNSEACLAEQKAQYMGMWFDMLSPKYHGLDGEQLFFRESEDVKQELGKAFLQHIKGIQQELGHNTFVMSNESFFSVGRRIAPFLAQLAEGANILFVLYVRDPKKWLPSAYAQWGMAHKTKPGPLLSFPELAPELLQQYQHLFFWHDVFQRHLVVRSYDNAVNVVADFSEAVGLRLEEPTRRSLERPEYGELALRAFFNSRFDSQVLPHVFSDIIPHAAIEHAPSLSSILNSCFDYSDLPAMLEATAEVEELLRDRYSIDFNQIRVGTETQSPSQDEIRNRVMDMLINIIFDQGARICQLERVMRENI